MVAHPRRAVATWDLRPPAARQALGSHLHVVTATVRYFYSLTSSSVSSRTYKLPAAGALDSPWCGRALLPLEVGRTQVVSIRSNEPIWCAIDGDEQLRYIAKRRVRPSKKVKHRCRHELRPPSVFLSGVDLHACEMDHADDRTRRSSRINGSRGRMSEQAGSCIHVFPPVQGFGARPALRGRPFAGACALL